MVGHGYCCTMICSTNISLNFGNPVLYNNQCVLLRQVLFFPDDMLAVTWVPYHDCADLGHVLD